MTGKWRGNILTGELEVGEIFQTRMNRTNIQINKKNKMCNKTVGMCKKEKKYLCLKLRINKTSFGEDKKGVEKQNWRRKRRTLEVRNRKLK